jgi:hypothetical protein
MVQARFLELVSGERVEQAEEEKPFLIWPGLQSLSRDSTAPSLPRIASTSGYLG